MSRGRVCDPQLDKRWNLRDSDIYHTGKLISYTEKTLFQYYYILHVYVIFKRIVDQLVALERENK